ncbi:hypothetical protein GPALN_004111 [Globodera pallida]|nr:hypothetical protein GPALN_004111 [Globodera pallida]
MVRILKSNGGLTIVNSSQTVEEAIKHCVGGENSPQNDYSLIFFGRKLGSDQRLADVPDLDDESRPVRLFCRKVPGTRAELSRVEVDKLRTQCRTMYQNLGEELQQNLDTYMVDQKCAMFSATLKDHPELLHDPLAISIVKDMRLLVPAIIENDEFAYEHPVCAKILKKALLQFGIMQQRPDPFMAQRPFNLVGQRARNDPGRGGAVTTATPTATTPPITADMLNQALTTIAMDSAHVAGPSQTAQPQQTATTMEPSVAPSAVQSVPDFAVQLGQLHEYGFTNDLENVQVLGMADGDVEQALQILIAMREDN